MLYFEILEVTPGMKTETVPIYYRDMVVLISQEEKILNPSPTESFTFNLDTIYPNRKAAYSFNFSEFL